MNWKRISERKKKLQKSYEQLAELTKNQLILECRKRGQKTKGNKTQLLSRLKNVLKMNTNSAKIAATAETSAAATTTTANNSKQSANGNTRTRKKSNVNHVKNGNGGTGSHTSTANNRNGSRSQPLSANSLVLWRRPLATLDLFVRELWYLSCKYGVKTLQYYKTIMFVVLMLVSFTALASFPGPYQQTAKFIYRQMLWCMYWCSLGVLSSIGLGTGLHTFLLYLGPHIAAVTLAAYECNSIAFPEPPYPDEIICPENGGGGHQLIDIWTIMAKVRLEAMCWGAGTALGELPPYFMAKAARLSNAGLEDEDGDDDEGEGDSEEENHSEIGKKIVKSVSMDSTDDYDDSDDVNNLDQLHLLQQKLDNHEPIGFVDRLKIGVEKLVARIGFFGILACASVPNPLFDLAGITCGHFLVPFWTFFGATLIGKAVVKMHIQQLFVIIAFNESLIENALQYLRAVPLLGKVMQEQFMQFLHSQKTRLHRKKMGVASDTLADHQSNILGWIFEKFVILMVLYFVASIVNSLAQNQLRRRKRLRNNKRKLQ